jgi:hypothetical protein
MRRGIMMYQTFEDIQAEKDILKQSIASKEQEIAGLWNELFHKEETEVKTPTQRLLSFANTGVGLFDGALLSWKLYKKFASYRSLLRRKK